MHVHKHTTVMTSCHACSIRPIEQVAHSTLRGAVMSSVGLRSIEQVQVLNKTLQPVQRPVWQPVQRPVDTQAQSRCATVSSGTVTCKHSASTVQAI
eukprot:18198-Heterococcus_DN1.PRE.1